MKQIVIGTAGHIDHGKTLLIKALTGVDTDRLKEEKRRGITIELGFAYLSLPGGDRVGIVDVPGHERFVKNMVAGAGGIDCILLVIAADEGVMPQTKEHLDICNLLGVNRGLVVLNKIDLVDGELRALAEEEIRDFLQGSFLADSPIIPVSSVTEEGIPELIAEIEKLAKDTPGRDSSGLFRLPIDRIFTMKGFGTVVTGTLISGQLNKGDTVEILPDKHKARVRGIQVHNQEVASASAGQRTAINLQAVERSQIERGDLLAHPGHYEPTSRMLAHLQLLPGTARPLRSRARFTFHLGTARVLGRTALLSPGEIQPGKGGFAVIYLERPIAAAYKDRFILRSFAYAQTIGGGEVLDPHPQKASIRSAEILKELEILRSGSTDEIVELLVDRTGYEGLPQDSLPARTNLTPREIADLIPGLTSRGKIIQLDSFLIHQKRYQEAQERIRENLQDYHQKFPLRSGMPREELKSRLGPQIKEKVFSHLLQKLIDNQEVTLKEEGVSLAEHRIELSEEKKRLKDEIEKIYREGQLEPPTLKELEGILSAQKKEIREAISILFREGLLIKVKDELYFHAKPYQELEERLRDFFSKNKEISPQEFKDLTRTSRKYTIPLLEYFDAQKITIRVGDKRQLREKVASKS
ncbi:MAG: selenocysteine-specific translation elongation factor [Deltaproteobacteria bacterium]|nr:MAG: selenocysteine-specific translation elongation factor [Deltaproteobacteria bacterium]